MKASVRTGIEAPETHQKSEYTLENIGYAFGEMTLGNTIRACEYVNNKLVLPVLEQTLGKMIDAYEGLNKKLGYEDISGFGPQL